MGPSQLGDKLGLALKALSMNRARLAADLAVDKSMVGRWVSGAVRPSAQNLHRLTELVAARRPDFTLLDWDRSLPEVAAALGVEIASDLPAGSDDFGAFLPRSMLEEIAAATRQQGHAYEGFWRTTRPAPEMPGRFLHDTVMMWVADNGMLLQQAGLSGFVLTGWVMPLRNQLFSTLTNDKIGMVSFSVFNGVQRQRAQVMDGINLSCLPDAGGSPVAAPCLMERVGELSGDVEADDARFRASLHEPPVAPEGSIPAAIRDHLYRDIGPAAAAAGGDPVMLLRFGRSLARGAAYGGQPEVPSADAPSVPPDGGTVLRPDFGRGRS